MALYLGKNKVRINLNSTLCNIYISASTEQPSTEGIILLSADNYILQDLNGQFITTEKEDE